MVLIAGNEKENTEKREERKKYQLQENEMHVY